MSNVAIREGVADLRIINMTRETRQLFKLCCVEEEISMSQKAIQLIEAYLKSSGKLK